MRIYNSKFLGLAFGAGLAIAGSTITASATSLTDGTFGNVTVTSSYAADPGTVISTSPDPSTSTPACASCGNPGPGVQQKANYANSATTPSFSDVGFIDNLLSYNPATQGAISTISASYDRLVIGTSPSATIRLVIEQGSNFYVATVPAISTNTTNGFTTLSVSDLTAINFLSYDNQSDYATSNPGTAHPDFAGGPILYFGIEGLFRASHGQTITATFDNIDITVSQTPLPSTWTMLIAGFVGLGFLAYRGTKKNSAALAAA